MALSTTLNVEELNSAIGSYCVAGVCGGRHTLRRLTGSLSQGSLPHPVPVRFTACDEGALLLGLSGGTFGVG